MGTWITDAKLERFKYWLTAWFTTLAGYSLTAVYLTNTENITIGFLALLMFAGSGILLVGNNRGWWEHD